MTIHQPSVPNWDPDVRKVAEEVDALFARPDWTSTYPGHGEGSAKGAYAIDYLCSRAKGDAIAAYVWKHRVRLGVEYMIWYKRIIRTYDKPGIPAGTWARYFNADSTNPSQAHTNHVHVSHKPSFTYKAPATPPAPKPVIDLSNLLAARKSGAQSPEVKAVQKALNTWRGSLKLVEDGYWGIATEDAYETYQAWRYDTVKGSGDADGIPGPESLGDLGFKVVA